MCDAEWAANINNRKSLSGNLIYLGPSLISYKMRQQRQVATSSAASELCELFQTAKTIRVMYSMLKELQVEVKDPVLLTDSASCVRTIQKSTQADQKHLGVYVHYLKELKAEIGLKIYYIPREENLADMFTKQVSTKEFISICKKLSEPFEWIHVSLENKSKEKSVRS